jgi:hypothetical protein
MVRWYKFSSREFSSRTEIIRSSLQCWEREGCALTKLFARLVGLPCQYRCKSLEQHDNCSAQDAKNLSLTKRVRTIDTIIDGSDDVTATGGQLVQRKGARKIGRVRRKRACASIKVSSRSIAQKQNFASVESDQRVVHVVRCSLMITEQFSRVSSMEGIEVGRSGWKHTCCESRGCKKLGAQALAKEKWVSDLAKISAD